jgi:hypothetical protein
MGNEANVLDYTPVEKENDVESSSKARKEGKTPANETDQVQFGVRTLMTTPIPACEKLDRMFGSGGEAIVHHMCFESGHSLFDNMIRLNARKSMDELLRVLLESQPRGGWGEVSMKIIHRNPPLADILVKNPAVKTVKGSQKYLIGSFWTGVLSRYFSRQLICKNFDYNAKRDEFSCTITI